MNKNTIFKGFFVSHEIAGISESYVKFNVVKTASFYLLYLVSEIPYNYYEIETHCTYMLSDIIKFIVFFAYLLISGDYTWYYIFLFIRKSKTLVLLTLLVDTSFITRKGY